MSSAANLGGVLDVTVLASPFAQIIYLREPGPWEAH